MSMKVALLTAIVGLLCVHGPAMGMSDRQRAYDACVKSYNSKFLGLPGEKAMVAGFDADGTSTCFWRSSANDLDGAIKRTLADCRARRDKCFVFATSDGLRDWARQVSDMGGNDGSRSYRKSSDDEDDGTAAIVDALVKGFGAIGGGGSRPTYTPPPANSAPRKPCVSSVAGATCGQR